MYRINVFNRDKDLDNQDPQVAFVSDQSVAIKVGQMLKDYGARMVVIDQRDIQNGFDFGWRFMTSSSQGFRI